MTTRQGISFNANLDISDVLSDFRRIEREAAQTARKVASIGRGAGGAAGRGLGGVGRTVGAGAGLGAGAAVFEQLIAKIFELFEDTPVLTQFTEALDLVFKAFGPVVGVLLESLTPVIKALTPAIEPLARALIPLVEIFGTNLLIAVTLLTPLITLAAQGVEFLTTGLQTFINAGINFVIDQLNKLPFVDIQLEISTTGDSFGRMSAQIEAAGDESDTAEPKVKMLADGVMAAGEAAETSARTQGIYADSQRIVDEVTANADARLEAYAKRLELSTMEVTTADRSLALMAEVTDRAAGSVDQLAHDMDLLDGDVSDLFQNIMTVATPAVSELDQRIADMTMQIMEAQTEAGLAEMAFAGLTPEMQMAAAELGLFGQAVTEVGAAAAAAATAAAAAAGAARDARNASSGNAALTNTHPGGGRTSGRFAGHAFTPGSGPITAVRELGGVLFFQTANSGGYEYNAARAGREAEARAWLNANRPPAPPTPPGVGEGVGVGVGGAGGPGGEPGGGPGGERPLQATAGAILDTNRAAGMLTDTLTGVGRASSIAEIATSGLALRATAGAVPISDLDKLLGQMRMRIEDTAAAAELQEMALALLSPEMRAAAEELGLFGLKVAEVAEMVQEEVAGLGGIVGGETFEERAAREYRDAQRELRIALANEEYIRRQEERQVNVLIDGETVATATTRAQSEGAG